MFNLSQLDSIPSIFEGAWDYNEISPQAVELAQFTFNEEGLYQAIVLLAEQWYRTINKPLKVLDLCSATGLSAFRVAKEIPVASVTLVDTDENALNQGFDYFTGICPVSIYCEDAVNFNNNIKYDLILMNSAYHHIEDIRKVDFLKTASNLLDKYGAIVVGDNFLPPYRDNSEFRQGVIEFYTRLFQELEDRNEPVEAVDVIKTSAFYCWKGMYEYKVSLERFLDDLEKSELKQLISKPVWSFIPDNSTDENVQAGSFAILIVKSHE